MTGATTAPTHPGPPHPSRALDVEQLRAVGAHDGVVQVIAPAGSGKTTVLVERVRELLRRGARPDRILCTTFNAAAATELRERLEHAGITSVEARTFHSIGLRIVTSERLTRGTTRRFTQGQWRRLCAQARRETGEWVEAADAREAISDIKLGELRTAREWRTV